MTFPRIHAAPRHPDPEAPARIAMGRPAEDRDPPPGGMRLDMLLMVAWIVLLIVGGAWAVLS